MKSRGIRNNNPLNIRRVKNQQWKGMALKQEDNWFVQFQTMAYGYRAAFWLLTRTYYHKYRLFTIRKIIERWAPPNENKTADYIKTVAGFMKYDPDTPLGIPMEHPERWMALVCAMTIVETGTPTLDYFAMLEGWGMCRQDAATGGY